MTANAILLKKADSEIFVKDEVLAEKTSVFVAETLVGGVEIIETISAEWISLCDEGVCNESIHRPEWFLALRSCFGGEITLVTIRSQGRLRAVLPVWCGRERLHGLPARKIAGFSNDESPRFDLIHGADEGERSGVMRELWNELRRQSAWNVLEFRMAYRKSWLGDLIGIAQNEGFSAGIWEMDGSPFASLPKAGNDPQAVQSFFEGYSKNKRHILKKKMRQLRECGNVEFVVSREYSLELMEKYIALEESSWKGKTGNAISRDDRLVNFYHKFARAASTKNAITFHELKLDGETIAMYLSLRYTGKTVGWKMSYDERFAKYSPGNLLFTEVLTECMTANSPELDMTYPPNHNKLRWASGIHEQVGFYIFNRGLVGSILNFWKFSVAVRLRKLKAVERPEEKSDRRAALSKL